MMIAPPWTAGVHHDGSVLFVSNPRPTLGETITIRLRTPLDAPIQHVFIRTAPDGEQRFDPMTLTERDAVSAWWTTELEITMPRTTYRFKIISDEGAYFYTAHGADRADSPDYRDFTILADFDGPTWLDDAVFYQIFPDRFFNGDPALTPKDGAWSRGNHSVHRREWGELPVPYSEAGNLDFYGGDLPGILEKLDYLRELGVNAIYLNPIFPSPSNHRYNISDFNRVDPYLGGDGALIALTDAMHEDDMHLILDVTPNHSGANNEWFIAAQADENAETAEYYTFYSHPDEYEMWLGVPTLPKLNYASQKLRNAMYRLPTSVLLRWLNEPYNIDGWRLDVANMTARQGDIQLSHEVWREMREAIKRIDPDAYVFGEDFFDGTPYLQGDELDATMNYQGFNIPTWRWLSGYDNGQSWRPETVDHMRMPSDAYADQLDRFRVAVPWVIAIQQFNQLCSHDTERILRIVEGDKALVKLGAALLMTYVGVPCIYYGDEIGMDGGKDPDNRRTMRWQESSWDTDLHDWYKRLIHLRKTAPALMLGGYQRLYTAGDLLVYQRQSPEQRLVIVAYRGADTDETITIPVRHGGIADDTTLVDLMNSGREVTVADGTIALAGLQHGEALVLEERV